ncbi:MAG: hypothetical protein P4M14_10300 [Gammaproteobacteria bacterium]|nr:hypothetical protein [Gammaproteobacteria bacterium]
MLSLRALVDTKTIWKKFEAKIAGAASALQPRPDKAVGDLEESEDKELEYFNYAQIEQVVSAERIPDVLNFLNSQPVKIATNQEQLDQLSQALETADYTEHPIFRHPHLPYLALNLYIKGGINRQQISTILEIQQTKAYGKLTCHRIIDPETKKLTSAARWYLLPYLRRTNFLLHLDDNQVNTFRELVAAAPLSEQVFYTIPVPALHAGRFRDFLVSHNTICLHRSVGNDQLVFLSFSAKNARLIARCGVDNMAAHVAVLGKKTVEHMQIGMQQDVRLADVDFPGVVNTAIHHDFEPEECGNLNVTSHDLFHAEVNSITPRSYRHALLRMADIALRFAREYGLKGCAARWDNLDQDLRYFLYSHAFDPGKVYGEADFCRHLDYGSGGEILRQSCAHLFNATKLTRTTNTHNGFTHLGVLVMIDMHRNFDVWCELGINPNRLTGSYKELFEQVRQVFFEIKDDTSAVQILKFQATVKMSDPSDRRACFDLIDASDLGKVKPGIKSKHRVGFLRLEFSPALNLESLDNLMALAKEYANGLDGKVCQKAFLGAIDALQKLNARVQEQEPHSSLNLFAPREKVSVSHLSESYQKSLETYKDNYNHTRSFAILRLLYQRSHLYTCLKKPEEIGLISQVRQYFFWAM